MLRLLSTLKIVLVALFICLSPIMQARGDVLSARKSPSGTTEPSAAVRLLRVVAVGDRDKNGTNAPHAGMSKSETQLEAHLAATIESGTERGRFELP